MRILFCMFLVGSGKPQKICSSKQCNSVNYVRVHTNYSLLKFCLEKPESHTNKFLILESIVSVNIISTKHKQTFSRCIFFQKFCLIVCYCFLKINLNTNENNFQGNEFQNECEGNNLNRVQLGGSFTDMCAVLVHLTQ